jgi:hypothetical protein
LDYRVDTVGKIVSRSYNLSYYTRQEKVATLCSIITSGYETFQLAKELPHFRQELRRKETVNVFFKN